MSEDIENAKKKFSGNHFILNTTNIDNVVDHVLFKKYVKNYWKDEKGVLQFISEQDNELKKAIPIILVDSNSSLESFKQVELSLENVFLRVISDGNETWI